LVVVVVQPLRSKAETPDKPPEQQAPTLLADPLDEHPVTNLSRTSSTDIGGWRADLTEREVPVSLVSGETRAAPIAASGDGAISHASRSS
jgi:hypothetical protein